MIDSLKLSPNPVRFLMVVMGAKELGSKCNSTFELSLDLVLTENYKKTLEQPFIDIVQDCVNVFEE